MRPRTRHGARLLALAIASALVPIGFAMKFSGSRLLANSLAGSVYEIFWCLLAFTLFTTQRAAIPIALAVFLATCGLEFLQLVDTPPLRAIRSTLIGRTILGSSFSWLDFPFYALGCLAGVVVMRAIASDAPYTRPLRDPGG